MGQKVDWKGIFSKCRKPWVMTVGGLVVGGLGVALFVVLLNYVIQPQMSIETRDIYAIRGERFNVWYHQESPHRASYADLNGQLEAALDDLLIRLDVEPETIPLPVDVLVHDDTRQLQTSIAQRKTAAGTHTFYAMLDLMGGEDPYPRMTELVLAFGWGQCFSQLLYEGTRAILIEPDRSYHAAVAAAPEGLRYSFEDLLALEAAGSFETTIYQRFDSPFSARLALSSLEGIASFYSSFSGAGGVAEEDLAALAAASLVEYLVQCRGGLDAIRDVWGPGSSRALFGRLACGPLDEINASWWAVAEDEGSTADDYEYFRAVHLFEAGDYRDVYRITSSWTANAVSSAGLALAVRASIAVGEFDMAGVWISTAGAGADQLLKWGALFDGWSRVEDDGITILGDLSEAEATQVLESVRMASGRVANALDLAPEQLPERMTVFCYGSEEERRAGQDVTSDKDSRRTAWHVVKGEDVRWAIVSSLPSYAYGIATASNLLQEGLAAAILNSYQDLAAAGCGILVEGNWTPLWQLGFGGVSSSLFQIESGLLVSYLIDTYGVQLIPTLWRATARLGGARSLDSAMLEYAGTSSREVEQELLNAVLMCD